MAKNERFEILEKQSMGLTKETYIIRDKQTGVQYLFHINGYGGGLTPLLGRDGQPVVTSYSE